MGFLTAWRFYGKRGGILKLGDEQAKGLGSTCDYVGREFMRRHRLNDVPAPVWDACVRKGTCPSGLTEAVVGLLSAHVGERVEEYAPLMVAVALHRCGETVKRGVAISLVKLMAPSQAQPGVSAAAATVLAPLLLLEPSPKRAREMRTWLMELTGLHLPNDHESIWATLIETAKEMKLHYI